MPDCEALQVVIGPLEAVSPTLAEQLHQCMLRAALSKAAKAEHYVLGNPKAWLGSAYHAVLAKAGAVTDSEAGPALAEAWEDAVERQHQQAQAHPLNCRFGSPEHWPGYHLVRAMALVRGKQLCQARRTSGSVQSQSARSDPGGKRERWLNGMDGRLVGRPDLVTDDTVVDYKTGDLLEHGEHDTVRAAYKRQLQLYAFLVKEETGRWPSRAVLVPLQGEPLEVDVVPCECEQAALEAVGALDRFNRVIETTESASLLASPSPATCRSCPYQLVCPAFWQNVDASWIEALGAVVISGQVVSEPARSMGGTAVTVTIQVQRGAEPGSTAAIGPLEVATHRVFAHLESGVTIRAVGLGRRPDGTIVPRPWTVVACPELLPGIVVTREAR